MLSTVVYTHTEWKRIWSKVREQNPPSITISWVMKKKIGLEIIKTDYNIRAVFDSDNHKTMFLLKYSG